MTRAFNKAINGEWAIEPEWIPRILEIAQREHAGLKAVEAERGEQLEYTHSVRVRDGVAIIPITGPIFRYANLFSYYSGGTSVSILARDFHTALNDARVDSILFEINSPGGEATGINELANMIYEARGRKPITGRVGGYCASAAYWLASACGDIVIDETAILGSIGVYAAYLDTKKRDAKEGVREIVIKSSQSPNKNPDPATPEGERRIQAKIDALAQVFVETVARNRDVSVETVLNEFGGGDCFVGQAAIDAGLADRLGSFEETLAELSAHGAPGRPGYTGALVATEDGTVSDEVHAEIEESFGEALEHAGGMRRKKAGESEEESETKPTAPDEEPDEDDEEASASSDLPTTKGAMEMAEENKTPETTAGAKGEAQVDAAALAALQAELAAANERAAANEQLAQEAATRIANLESAALTSRLQALAANFTGDISAKVSLMEKIVGAFGEDSEELKAYVADQNAVAEQLKAGGLFKENGSDAGAGEQASALEQLNAKAREIAATNSLSFEQAFVKATEANPALYQAYLSEQSR